MISSFKFMSELYPIHDTLIGFYDDDGTFTITKKKAILSLDQWEHAPLDHSEGYMPFVEYLGEGKFECHFFAYTRVTGYYVNDEWGANWQLVTYSKDLGYEVTDPESQTDDMLVMLPDGEDEEACYDDWATMVSYENMNSHVARYWDSEKWHKGLIFTTNEALIEFVMNSDDFE